MPCHVDCAKHTTIIIDDFLRELRANAFVMTQFLIDSRDVVPNSIIICFNNLK